jgi:integrase
VLAKNSHGTIPWIIDTFKQSPQWQKLRPNTVARYGNEFRHILRWSAARGDPPMRTVTRRDAEQLWASLQSTPAEAHLVIVRCAQLWNYALDLDEDVVTRNPFQRLGLPHLPSRSQVWQPGQITAVVQTAIRMDRPSIALAVIIAINTAQRPSDICALRWSQYDGRIIALTQIKTGKTVTIPVTEQLKVALDNAWRARTKSKVIMLDADGPIIISRYNPNRGLDTRSQFGRVFREICQAAGIPDTL